LEELQDTWIDLRITGNPKGLDAKQPEASSSSDQMRTAAQEARVIQKSPALMAATGSGDARNRKRSLGEPREVAHQRWR
jgi:hypothetical protein